MSIYTIDTNSNQITFADSRFYRTESGNHVPSVTTILSAYPKDAHFYQWLKQVGSEADEIRDMAGKRGSVVHSLTEQYDAGMEVTLLNNSGNIDFKLDEWSMFERYVDFRANVNMDVIMSEFNIVSETLGYAGTIDRVASIDGVNYLIDIKTSNSVHEHYWLQLAAYKRLIQSQYDSSTIIDKVAILWLNAKTRTRGKAGQIQGPGWQLLTREGHEEQNDAELFDATHLLWKHQNKSIQPRNLTYSITHKI